jgi:hypothetical protein
MADGIKLADLLALQTAINDNTRREVSRAEEAIGARLNDVKDTLHAHGRRLDALERGRSILTLSRKQKTAIWSLALAMCGALLDGVRHLGGWLFAMWAKGVHP